METLLNNLDHPRSRTLTAIIIVLGLIMIAILTYYVFMPFSDFVVNELQQGVRQVDYTSL
jgi:hypothetical protein